MFPEYPHDFKCDIDFIQQFNKQKGNIKWCTTFKTVLSIGSLLYFAKKAIAELQHTAVICDRICGSERIVRFNDLFINTATCFITEWMNDSMTHS